MEVFGILCGMLFWGPVMFAWIAYLRSGKPSKSARLVGTLLCIGLPLFIAGSMAKFMIIDGGLASAVQAKDMGQVKLYLLLGADPNRYDDYVTPPLVQAAGDGEEEIVRLLLKRGADVKGVNSSAFNSVTALSAAQEHGYDKIVKLLREAGTTQ